MCHPGCAFPRPIGEGANPAASLGSLRHPALRPSFDQLRTSVQDRRSGQVLQGDMQIATLLCRSVQRTDPADRPVSPRTSPEVRFEQ
jgi:hypothetical protein